MLKNLRNLRREKKKGFTLMELIIVIAIIGIIALFAIPNFLNAKNNAYKDSDINLARNIAHTVDVFIADGTIKTDEKKDTTIAIGVPTVKAPTLSKANADIALSIEKNIKPDTFVLKTKEATGALTITIDNEGKVSKITESTVENVLYPAPGGIYKK